MCKNPFRCGGRAHRSFNMFCSSFNISSVVNWFNTSVATDEHHKKDNRNIWVNCVLYILISTETAKLVVFIDVLIEISSLKMPVIVW